jgi:hypothetical protein
LTSLCSVNSDLYLRSSKLPGFDALWLLITCHPSVGCHAAVRHLIVGEITANLTRKETLLLLFVPIWARCHPCHASFSFLCSLWSWLVRGPSQQWRRWWITARRRS